MQLDIPVKEVIVRQLHRYEAVAEPPDLLQLLHQPPRTHLGAVLPVRRRRGHHGAARRIAASRLLLFFRVLARFVRFDGGLVLAGHVEAPGFDFWRAEDVVGLVAGVAVLRVVVLLVAFSPFQRALVVMLWVLRVSVVQSN